MPPSPFGPLPFAPWPLACATLIAWGVLACSKVNEGDKATDETAGAAASLSSPPPSAASSEATQAVAAKPGCRALEVVGNAAVDGTPIHSDALLDGEHWIVLDAGASVSLRHTVTTRELKLLGPAKVLPCRAGSEQILLATGRLATSANLGVRPGAEVLIATPEGTVRYGDAALDVELAGQGLRVRVKQGEAWVEPEARAKPRFKNPLRTGGEAHLPPQPVPATELVTACQAAARAAAGSAMRVAASAAGSDAGVGSLGERAAAHMRERGKARIACAVAAAAIGAAPGSAATERAERDRLSAAITQADELWQSVPHVPRTIPGKTN